MMPVIFPDVRHRYAGADGAPMKSIDHPKHPERVCWGCDKYCPADDLACGNGTVRTQHPCELFGDDWLEWSRQRQLDRGERRWPTRR